MPSAPTNGRPSAQGPVIGSGELSPPVRPLDGPLLTPGQAAELLSVKVSWIYEATRTGKLPCIRLGRHIRFTRGMLEEWLAG